VDRGRMRGWQGSGWRGRDREGGGGRVGLRVEFVKFGGLRRRLVRVGLLGG
jgi:hypothetical protein